MRIFRRTGIAMIFVVLMLSALIWVRYTGLKETANIAGFSQDELAKNAPEDGAQPNCQTLAVHAQIRRTGLPTERSLLHSLSRSFDAVIADVFFGTDFCMRYEKFYVSNRNKVNQVLIANR